jgi:hypothetical protein
MLMPFRPGNDDSYDIAYSEAASALRSQAEVLESYQARAATIVSAATIATSFLGTEAFKSGHISSGWAWVAILCFAGVLGACCIVLWPRFGWEFSVYGEKVIDDSIESEKPLSAPEIKRDLAIYMSRALKANHPRLRILVWALQAAVIALALEIGAWVVTLH